MADQSTPAKSPISNSRMSREPTSPTGRSLNQFEQELLDENEKMLDEIFQLRDQVDETESIRNENAALRKQNDDLKRKLEIAEGVKQVVDITREDRKRQDEALSELKEMVSSLKEDVSPQGRSRSQSQPPPQTDFEKVEHEKEELHRKLQEVAQHLSSSSLFLDQSRLENSVLLEKNAKLERDFKESQQVNRELIKKYGVAAEEAKKIEEKLRNATHANDKQMEMHAKLESLLKKSDYSRNDLRQLFSDFLDHQERMGQEHEDRMTAQALQWKDQEEQYTEEIKRLKRRVNELETKLSNHQMTIRRDPNAASGVLVTPRGGPPSASHMMDGSSSSVSPGGVPIERQLGQNTVSTPRVSMSGSGFVKRCPVCTYANDGNNEKCQVCSTKLASK